MSFQFTALSADEKIVSCSDEKGSDERHKSSRSSRRDDAAASNSQVC